MKRIERILAICILLLTCFSCQKNEELLHAGVATIQFNLTESEFELPQQALGKYGQKQAMIENKVVPVGEWFMEVSIKAKDGLQKTASDNVVKNSIPKGVYYRILVFDSNNRFLESKDYVVGAGQQDYLQLSTSEKYSFIVYSLGKNEPLPAINLVKGDLKNAAFLQLESVEDVMVAQQENVQLHAGDNNLNLVLRHVFGQVAVEINSSEVGSIQGIEALELSNTYRSAKELLGAEKTPLTFAANLISSKISNITIGTDKYSAYGVPTLFYADGAQIINLSAKGITIDGIKRDVDLLTMRALPGISYTVTIQFKKKQNSLEGFEDGNVIWASGNLIRDANGNYAFASSQGEYGDYWYRDEQGHVYTQPFGEVNKTSTVGGKVENICGLVGKGWRLPTYKLCLSSTMIFAFSRLELRLGTFLVSQAVILAALFLATVLPHEFEVRKIFLTFFLWGYLSS